MTWFILIHHILAIKLIEFLLPEKISTNKIYSGIHWGLRKKHKDLFRSVPINHPPVIKYPVNLFFDFQFKGHPLDTTNCSYMAKLIEDSLVHQKILLDDSPKHVQWVAIKSGKGAENKAIIHIRDIDLNFFK